MPNKNLVDETGNVYWRWTVIESKKHRGRTMWLCRCICGNEQCIPGTNLRKGVSKSCGCLTGEIISRAKVIDITGKRYGKLVAVKIVRLENRGNCNTTWECKCDCGETVVIQRGNLVNGFTKSCGCLKKELLNLPPCESSFNRVVENMRRSASKRGYEWNLSNEQVKEITQQNCFYCGIPPAQGNGHRKERYPNGTYIYNGIDRVDNTGGYIIDNVVTCCASCNMGKRTMTISEFRDWTTRVYNNFSIRDGVQDRSK